MSDVACANKKNQINSNPLETSMGAGDDIKNINEKENISSNKTNEDENNLPDSLCENIDQKRVSRIRVQADKVELLKEEFAIIF